MPLDPIRIGLAYVEARAEQCRRSLAEGLRQHERPRMPYARQRRPWRPGNVCYRCPMPHVIEQPDHRPVGLKAVQAASGGKWAWIPDPTLNNWSPAPVAMREFEPSVGHLLDRQLDGDFLEAAE